MSSSSHGHHRRSIRLPDYDYTLPGAYFVTICTWHMQCVFGEIKDAEMQLNPLGRIVEEEWTRLACQFLYIDLDTYVVMPNHIHGIIVITESVGATRQHPIDNLSGK